MESLIKVTLISVTLASILTAGVAIHKANDGRIQTVVAQLSN